MASQPTVVLHPLSGYSFGIKEAQANDEPSVQARMARLQSEFSTKGMRESVEGVLLVHEHGHPHVLVLQVGGSFYKLPGGTLKLGEDVAKGLKRLVNEKLAPPGEDATDEGDFEVGELLSVWWRPNFDNMMYPYLPAHIKRAKEMKRVYLVHLPPNKILSVPRNMKLLAVPLFELYENASRYGAQLAALPHVLARFGIKFDDALLEKSGLTQAELQELAEIFSLVDVDHGGTISRQELESLMATVGFKASRDELDEMMNEIDKGTGEIDFESFVLTVTKKLQTSITSNELRRAFAVLQRYDPSTYPPGQISMSELIKAFTEYPDNKLSMDDAKELIRQVSSNSDKDTFNFNQFMGLYFNT